MITNDPVAIARAVLLLLQTGRPGMAQLVLEKLPAAIESDRESVGLRTYAAGREAGRQSMRLAAKGKPQRVTKPVLRKPNRLDELRTAAADPSRRALALSVLKIDERALDLILVGRSTLASTQWRRLREALA